MNLKAERAKLCEKMTDNPKSSASGKRPTKGNTSAPVYAAQCGECFKWRTLPTLEEFEDIRSRFVEEPFFCNKKANASCEDPADIEYDATRIWAINKPNLPKTPTGFRRELVLRRDFSKMDCYYVTPDGKRLNAITGVASYLEAHPEYKGASVSDFTFSTPKMMDSTSPLNVERKGSTSGNKRMKALRDGEDDI